MLAACAPQPTTQRAISSQTPSASPAAEAPHSQPPLKLVCLARHYPGVPRRLDGSWWLELRSGRRLLFDDGIVKTFEERLERPDLEDVFATRYPRGRAVAVTAPNGDPGRTRVDALFAETYGRTEADVRQELTIVDVAHRPFSVHRKIEPALRRVSERLKPLLRDPKTAALFEHPGGGFVDRNIHGTTRRSVSPPECCPGTESS